MYPRLFENTFPLSTYFILIVLAWLATLFLMALTARRWRLSPRFALNFGGIAFIGAFWSARILAMLVGDVDPTLRGFFELWRGGYSIFGALAGSIGAACFYLHQTRTKNGGLWFDLAAAPLALGMAIARLGCLANGCCYGVPSASRLAIVFTHPLARAPRGVPLAPVQLIEVFFLVTAAVFLFMRRSPPSLRQSGTHFLTLITGYALFRIVIEFWRADAVPQIGPLTITQEIAAIVIMLSLAMLFRKSLQWRKIFSKNLPQRRASGFTLLELMIVIAIIGLLAVAATPFFLNAIYRSRAAEAPLMLGRLTNAEIGFYSVSRMAEGEHSSIVNSTTEMQCFAGLGAVPDATPSSAARAFQINEANNAAVANALGFQSASPVRYAYSVQPNLTSTPNPTYQGSILAEQFICSWDGTQWHGNDGAPGGAAAYVMAHGDLDGNAGTYAGAPGSPCGQSSTDNKGYSIYSRQLSVNPDDKKPIAGLMVVYNELE